MPYKLLDALADYSLGHLEDVEFYYGAGFKPYKMGMPPFNGHLNVKSFFSAPSRGRSSPTAPTSPISPYTSRRPRATAAGRTAATCC